MAQNLRFVCYTASIVALYYVSKATHVSSTAIRPVAWNIISSANIYCDIFIIIADVIQPLEKNGTWQSLFTKQSFVKMLQYRWLLCNHWIEWCKATNWCFYKLISSALPVKLPIGECRTLQSRQVWE